MPKFIEISVDNRIARVTLNRPEVHNAFDDELIYELTDALTKLEEDDAIRAVVLAGNGPSFSAGADLNWMRRMADMSEADNRADSERLARLMRTLNDLSKTTIARVHGAAYGGGVGLVACCDIVVASDAAKFGLTEVKLGLVPAVISPYVIAAVGVRHARRLFLTAETFDAVEAHRIGLVHHCVPAAQLDARVDDVLALLRNGGPFAQREAKKLVGRIGASQSLSAASVDADNAALIARLRVSAEGQEGIGAFLSKRKAQWTG